MKRLRNCWLQSFYNIIRKLNSGTFQLTEWLLTWPQNISAAAVCVLKCISTSSQVLSHSNCALMKQLLAKRSRDWKRDITNLSSPSKVSWSKRGILSQLRVIWISNHIPAAVQLEPNRFGNREALACNFSTKSHYVGDTFPLWIKPLQEIKGMWVYYNRLAILLGTK